MNETAPSLGHYSVDRNFELAECGILAPDDRVELFDRLLHGIHAGVVRVEGTAPDGLLWEVGCAPGREPLMRRYGDRYA